MIRDAVHLITRPVNRDTHSISTERVDHYAARVMTEHTAVGGPARPGAALKLAVWPVSW
jgi:hypothetical protein